jgi:hypothetical protein
MWRALLTLAVAALTTRAVPGQQPKSVTEPTAKILLVGNFPLGARPAPREIEVDGKKLKAHSFEAAKMTRWNDRLSFPTVVHLQTDQDMKAVLAAWEKAQETYTSEIREALSNEKDDAKRKELLQAHRDSLFKPPPFALIEGTVVGVRLAPLVLGPFKVGNRKDDVKQVVVSGKVRLLDAKERQKWLPTGGYIVEGEPYNGKFEVGKKTYTVAIKNGKLPVVLTGELATRHANVTGMIRVTGQLRAEATRFLLAVEAIEVLKK